MIALVGQGKCSGVIEVFATHGKIYEELRPQMFGVPVDKII